MTGRYGEAPEKLDVYRGLDVVEFMHWQYLPVLFPGNTDILLPVGLEPVRDLVIDALLREGWPDDIYAYVTARHGWATPESPLNRPGWHCDGFGSDDINYVWWSGPGTRFVTYGENNDFVIPDDHLASLDVFERIARTLPSFTYRERTLLRLTPYVIHAVPDAAEFPDPRGCMRTFVKVSISRNRYNLLGNSHNERFDYSWKMWPRDVMRNDPAGAQGDHYPDERVQG